MSSAAGKQLTLPNTSHGAAVQAFFKSQQLSGIGDVLYFHTARDWALAAKHGKYAPWPYNEKMLAEARAVMERLISTRSGT
jgi:hypothetical protein